MTAAVAQGASVAPVGVWSEQARVAAVHAARNANPLRPVAEALAEVDQAVGGSSPVGPLAPLLDDDAVSEVLVNGPGPVWVERDGQLCRSEVSIGSYELDLVIERILTPLGLRVDRSSPIVDARLPDGSRVNVVVPPLSIDGPAVSIRRFRSAPVGLPDFGPAAVVNVLSGLVASRASILIVGATSSGKTTLINALSGLVHPSDRVVCLEDTAELQLAVHNLVRLEARPANSEGVGEIPLRDLVRTAMRMRPDRLVVGEVRGAEAFDLLLALTSGHRGCLTSCHGADPAAALRRLETLAAMAGSGLGPDGIRTLVYDGLDAVVALGQVGNRQRRVVSVMALTHDGMQPLWPVERSDAPVPLSPVALSSASSVGAAERRRAC